MYQIILRDFDNVIVEEFNCKKKFFIFMCHLRECEIKKKRGRFVKEGENEIRE